MLIETSEKLFYHLFRKEQHPFLKQQFIELNKHKVEKIVYLIGNDKTSSIGLIAGIKKGLILSHFSAPFGGFHYKHENIYISEIEHFVDELKEYIRLNNYNQIYITFPPSLYGITFNSKMIHVLLKKQFEMESLDLTNWVGLDQFENKFKQRNSREYYNQSIKNQLQFKELKSNSERIKAFELIQENRKRFNRPLFMTFDDLIKTGELWDVDFFGVFDPTNKIVASGIFYQFPKDIVYAVFWGDNEIGRPLRAMDFLIFNLWSHYKNKGFSFIDLGISTENDGIVNEGLLRFKETHEAHTELKFKLSWKC